MGLTQGATVRMELILEPRPVDSEAGVLSAPAASTLGAHCPWGTSSKGESTAAPESECG